MSSERKAWLTRRDGTVVLGHGPFEEVSQAPQDGVAFYKRDFFANEDKPWKIPSSFEILSSEEFRALVWSDETLDGGWTTPDASPFSCVFQEVMTAIRQGVIEKTVPVVTELGLNRVSPATAISAAMARQISPLQSYGWVSENDGFAGATPELLFSLDGLELETMALAGTARREDEEVFGVDEKEIREHEYVAQTLVSKLLDLGQLTRKSREVLRLGSIVHFHTGISLSLENPLDPEFLLRRLHPTPALGPLPRTDQTMAMLQTWRKQLGCPAEFGAPFGVWQKGHFEAVVAIRGLWWQGNQILLPAGCGIIEASRLVNEWRELRLKRDSVKNFIFGQRI
jgi:menaquinone-specific isochorismate synthase